jgi:hypothetical protein
MPETSRRRTKLPQEHAHVEYLILADRVEALNGKLYMMGGGWETLFTTTIEQPVSMSIACGVLVPWNETDDDHVLGLSILDLDGNAVAPPLSLRFKTGRPPTLEKGAATHVPFAVQAQFKFAAFGEYRVIATVDDQSDGAHRLPFWIKGLPVFGGPQA